MTTDCDYSGKLCIDTHYNPACQSYETTISIEWIYFKNGMRHRRNYDLSFYSDMSFNFGRNTIDIYCDADLAKLNDRPSKINVYDVTGKIFAKGGDDLLFVVNPTLAVWANMGTGNDIALGALKRDTLFGGDGNDFLAGFGDNDKLYGGNGSDTLSGGSWNDFLSGGNGCDYLYGDQDCDTLCGDDGNDFLAGGSGDDIMTGGAGCDTFAFNACDYVPCQVFCDTIRDFSCDDTILLQGFRNYGGVNGRWIKVVNDRGTAQLQINVDKSGGADFFVRIEGMNYRDFMRDVGTYIQFEN